MQGFFGYPLICWQLGLEEKGYLKGDLPLGSNALRRVYHEKHSNLPGIGPGGRVIPFFARYDTGIFSVARHLRFYYRNMIITIIASSGIFISGCGE